MMQNLKVLILEDNPFQLMTLHQMLNACRIFDVLTASSLEAARHSLAVRGAIDIAICDLYLDTTSGLDLITELAKQRNASALIIQTCAAPHVVEKAASRARREGLKVLGSLTKPVSVGRLNQLLQAYQVPCFNTLGR